MPTLHDLKCLTLDVQADAMISDYQSLIDTDGAAAVKKLFADLLDMGHLILPTGVTLEVRLGASPIMATFVLTGDDPQAPSVCSPEIDVTMIDAALMISILDTYIPSLLSSVAWFELYDVAPPAQMAALARHLKTRRNVSISVGTGMGLPDGYLVVDDERITCGIAPDGRISS